MKAASASLLALWLASCAYAPLADSPQFAVVVADEASRLAAASTPESRVRVVLDVLDERVRQIEALRDRDRSLSSELAFSYRLMAREALHPALAEAPSTVTGAKARLLAHERRLAAFPEAYQALDACRDVLDATERMVAEGTRPAR